MVVGCPTTNVASFWHFLVSMGYVWMMRGYYNNSTQQSVTNVLGVRGAGVRGAVCESWRSVREGVGRV